MALALKINAFPNGSVIPARHACEGADVSPALSWTGAPAGVKSFALIVDDPDAPGGTWNHWLLWDLPATTESLPESFEPGSAGVSGRNDSGQRGYSGPCPPRGHGPHRYFFKLFALDRPSLGLSDGSSRQALDSALQGHILAQAQQMGTYERKKQ
jgi:Raf kinase inhibitor-like YbhB/YbcL family protein